MNWRLVLVDGGGVHELEGGTCGWRRGELEGGACGWRRGELEEG